MLNGEINQGNRYNMICKLKDSDDFSSEFFEIFLKNIKNASENTSNIKRKFTGNTIKKHIEECMKNYIEECMKNISKNV